MMIIALDPLLSSDIGLSVILVMLMKVVIAFALLMVSVMLVIWFERKIVADMHNRVGPSPVSYTHLTLPTNREV